MYISLYGNTQTTRTFDIEFDGAEADFEQVSQYSGQYNALGFNPLDNYIYGARIGSNEIVRLGADGTVQTVGSDPTISRWSTGAGDVSPSGVYVIHERSDNTLNFYELAPTFRRTAKVTLTWDPASGQTGEVTIALDDIVFDFRNNNSLFAYQRGYPVAGEPAATRGALLRINADASSPQFGVVSVINTIPPEIILQMGALFFDAGGQLYGYGSLVFGPLFQDRLVRIDQVNGSAERIGRGPAASSNDGCSCPYTLKFAKELDDISSDCDSVDITYQYTITNNGFADAGNFFIADDLPPGASLVEVEPPSPLGGTVTFSASPTQLSVSNAAITVDTSLSFTVTVRVPRQDGVFSSQARLTGLSMPFADRYVSDDPSTSALNDATLVQFPSDTANFVEVESFASICAGEQFTFNDREIAESGTYLDTLFSVTAGSCDTLVRLDLTVQPPSQASSIRGLCEGDSLMIADTLITTAGSYSFLFAGRSSTGCDSILNLTVTESFLPEFTVDIGNESCNGNDGSITILIAPPAQDSITYALNGGAPQLDNRFSGLAAGDYIVSILPQGDCGSTETSVQVEEEVDSLSVSFNGTPYRLVLGDSIPVGVFANFTIDSLTYEPAGLFRCPDCLMQTVRPLASSLLTVTAFDPAGCSAAAASSIEVIIDNIVYVPNAFTPDGDGNNDIFRVFPSSSVASVDRVEIYNRWGGLVFEYSGNPLDGLVGWDGTLNGRPVDPGVYVYHVQGRLLNSEPFLDQGSIHVIR